MTQHIKPQISGLNTGHALYADIQAFLEFGQLDKELVSDTALTTTAALVDDPEIGDARTFAATADAVAETVTVNGDCTILVVAKHNGLRANGNASECYFVNGITSGNQISFYYRGYSPYYHRAIFRGGSGTYRTLDAAGYASDAAFNQGHAFAATFAQSAVMRLAEDGALGNTESGSTSAQTAGIVCSFMHSLGASASVNVGAIVIFNRVLNDSELQSITSDPWALTAEANADPVLDTPQSDVTIQEGQTGTIQAGANFSDANTGDTLTFSINPNINTVQGFTFNTSTGAIVYDGSQVAAGAVSYTVTCYDGKGGTPATDTFTITVLAPQFSIGTPPTTTPTAGTTLTIPFSNEAGAITASCSAGAMTGTYSAGQFVLDVPEPPLFGNLTLTYQQNVVVTFSDGATTQQLTIQIQVPSGQLFAEITSIDPDGVYANDVGLVVGDFAHFKNISGNIVIDPATGLYSADPSQNTQFSYSIYDVSTGDWSDAYQTNTYTAESEPPVITLNGANPLVWVQGTAWVDPQATVTDNVDATRQINADNTPSINTVGTYTLNYNATDAAGNAATQVTRTVNVVASDITPNQFTFTDVNNAELNTLYENIQPIIDVDAGQTLTATGGLLLSNDGGQTWNTSVQMVTGQTYVKAAVTTGNTNGQIYDISGAVNGISDTFSVTTKAAVTRTFSIGSSDPVVNSSGANVTYTYPVWEIWDKIPEDPTAVIVDSGVNFAVTNGVGSVQTSSAQTATNYVFIARDPGNTPDNYIRTLGQVA